MPAILKRHVDHKVEIELSGEDIAGLFWSLDEREQSKFFNALGTEPALPFQLQAVTDCPMLETSGRIVMARIGEYSAKYP